MGERHPEDLAVDLFDPGMAFRALTGSGRRLDQQFSGLRKSRPRQSFLYLPECGQQNSWE